MLRPEPAQAEASTRKLKQSPESVEVNMIGLIAKGDLSAFESLYRLYFPRLTRFLDRMTRSPHLIEEIVNDTMMVVWQKASTFNHTAKVSTWIFAIAYRKAMKAVTAFDDPVESDAETYLAPSEDGPEHDLDQKQVQKILSVALDALSFDQRNVVNLAYYHGMAYAEIAEIMECPVNTVKTRMFHAHRRIKALVSTQFGEWR